jgi:hypothetical protein
MQKLIDAYRAAPSDKAAARVLKHYDKHPFAGLLLSRDDQALVARLLGY